MTSEYYQLYISAGFETFRARVMIAAVKVAIDVGNEAKNTKNHDNRAVLSRGILLDPKSRAETLSIVVMAFDPTLADPNTPDSAIYNALSAVWNIMAGGL